MFSRVDYNTMTMIPEHDAALHKNDGHTRTNSDAHTHTQWHTGLDISIIIVLLQTL